MSDLRVLLVGETWITVAQHYKGWDHFTSTTFHDGAELFKHTLRKAGVAVRHIPSHLAATEFPSSEKEMDQYDVIILSDIGVNSLMLHPGTWLEGKPTPNRLTLLREYVASGGGFIMVGGYYSFQGIYGRAAYKGTPAEEVLPVAILSYDDRTERPEGITPERGPGFNTIPGLPDVLRPLLGYNKSSLKKDGILIYHHEKDPILAVREFGNGRSAAWTSDIGPHWCPKEFLIWEGYATLWEQIIRWTSGRK